MYVWLHNRTHAMAHTWMTEGNGGSHFCPLIVVQNQVIRLWRQKTFIFSSIPSAPYFNCYSFSYIGACSLCNSLVCNTSFKFSLVLLFWNFDISLKLNFITCRIIHTHIHVHLNVCEPKIVTTKIF